MVRLCETEDSEPDQERWPWLDQASLIIGWHTNKEYWSITDFGVHPDNTLIYRNSGLWQWDGGDIIQDGYFFALPLFAPRNEIDLQRFVAAPLLELFASKSPSTAAEEALRDVPILTPPQA